MRKIVFEFILSDKLRVSQPEKLFIAIRSIFGIHDYIQSQLTNSNNNNINNNINNNNSNNTNNTPPEKEQPKYDMSTYMPSICDFFSKLLKSLDGIFGNWLLFNQSRTVVELLQKEKLNSQSFVLLRNCISHIPPIIPSGITPLELVTILTRYLVHIDTDIRERSWNVLSSLMKSSEMHRKHIVYGMATYLLTIPDMKTKILTIVMLKLLKMINYWIYACNTEVNQLSSDIPQRPAKIDLKLSYEIEGIALIYLCNFDPEVRDLALEILMGVRRLAESSIEILPDTLSLPPTRVTGIIEENGSDIIEKLKNDFSFNIENPFPKDMESLSLKTLAVSKYQFCWGYCLGELIILINELCPEIIDSIRKQFTVRIEEISKTGVPIEQEGLISLWRNYITVGCIIINDPIEAKDLYMNLTSFLKTESHREAAIFALQRANIRTIDSLSVAMKSFEIESGSKKGKKRDKIRNEIGRIFSSISNRFYPGFISNNERAKLYYIQFLVDSIQYLTDTVIEESILARNNFCIIVHNLGIQYSEFGDDKPKEKDIIIDVELRQKLFKLFSQWTDNVGNPDPILYEATVKKRKLNPVAFEALFLKMQQLACSAAASVLKGISFSPNPFTIDDPVLVWIRNIRKSERKELRDIAIEALEYYIMSNRNESSLSSIVLDNCYCSEKEVSDAYFIAIVEVYKKGGSIASFSMAILFHLILFKLGDSDRSIRRCSIQLLQILSNRTENEDNWGNRYSPPAIDGFIFEVYQAAQLDLSSKLANDYPELTFQLFDEFVHRIDSVTSLHQKLMLSYLLSWIRKMELNILDGTQLQDFLKNMFWLTIKYNGDPHHFTHLAQIWETLAKSHNDNIPLIIDSTLSIGVTKRNQRFINLAKRVMIFISRSNSQQTIDTLVNELSTITKLRGSLSSVGSLKLLESSDGSSGTPRGSSGSRFDKEMLCNRAYVTPARGHFALLLLTELSCLPSLTNELIPHLPILLQQVFLGLDHSNDIVYDHCRLLLQNLIEMLIILKLEKSSENFQDNETYIDAKYLIEFLKSKEDLPFWERDDLSHENTHIISADQLCSLVVQVMDVLTAKFPDLRENWGIEALAWAISCPDYHWRCRSFQIYRALNPEATPEILNDIISALIKWLPMDDSGCGIELEILYTLQVISSSANTNRLVLFNQLFWCAIALLNSDFEVIYLQAVTMLSIILERVSFLDKAVQHVFLASRPKVWATRFFGIQPILLKGLLNPNTESLTIDLLIKIVPLPLNEIFQPDSTRLLVSILSLQPWLCAHIGNYMFYKKIHQAADYLSSTCDSIGLTALSKIYGNLPKSISDVGVFLLDWCRAFSEAFFPEHGLFTFILLTELLHNGPIQYHRAILCILQLLVKFIDINIEDFNPRIPQWYGLVSQLICSEIWKEALLVLESAIEQSCLESEEIDIESLHPFRSYKKSPSFTNTSDEGNVIAANCLENVLSFAESTKSSENKISPRAFCKFFAEGDTNTDEITKHDEEESESGEHSGDTDDEFSAPIKTGYNEHPDMGGFGILDTGPSWSNAMGGFFTDTGFDDILADIRNEGETDDLDTLSSFEDITNVDSHS